MYDDRQLDDLLDRGLREYAQAEPPPALEDRILVNLRTQPEPRPRWRVWMPALAAAAVVLVIAALALRPHQPTGPRATPRAATNSVPAPLVEAARSQSSSRPRALAKGSHRERQVASRRQPWRPFPTPAPLPPAEQAMIAALRGDPSLAKSVVDQQQQARRDAEDFMKQVSPPPNEQREGEHQ